MPLMKKECLPARICVTTSFKNTQPNAFLLMIQMRQREAEQ